jgi:hypothetical protein
MEKKIRIKKPSKMEFFWKYLLKISKLEFTPISFSYNPYDREQHQNLYCLDQEKNLQCIPIKKIEIDNIGLFIQKTQKRLHDCPTDNPDKIIFYAIRYNNKKDGSLLISKIDGFWIMYQIGNYPVHITNSINFVMVKIYEWENNLLQKEDELPKTKKDLEVTKELILQDAA